MAKRAALGAHSDEHAQNDAPKRSIYQRPDTLPAAAAIQAQPKQDQNGRNTVPELWMLHTITSKNA